MRLLKVVLQVEGPVDLNDPPVQEAVLKYSLIPPLDDLSVNKGLQPH